MRFFLKPLSGWGIVSAVKRRTPTEPTKKMQSHKFQINENHLGSDATPADAIRLAEILTDMGYESEYNPTQGVKTGYSTDQGDSINIPDSAWDRALGKMLA